MNRLLVACLLTVAVSTGCSTGPVIGGTAAESPSVANTQVATRLPATSSAMPDPTSTPFPYSDDGVRIVPGTYRIPSSAWSVADFTVTFPDRWTVQYGHVFHAAADTDGEIELYAVRPDTVYADACAGTRTGKLTQVGPSVADLADALLQQPGAEGTAPIDTRLGGYPSVRIDLMVREGLDLEACSMGGIGLQIWYSPPADKYFVLLADGTASVYIVDVHGERQVFLTQHRSATTAEDLMEREAVLDSIRILP